jgi:hypothetical protein
LHRERNGVRLFAGVQIFAFVHVKQIDLAQQRALGFESDFFNIGIAHGLINQQR